MRALSIRQPYAEMILRGIKPVEWRSRPTRLLKRRFYIYAAKAAGRREDFHSLGMQPGDLPTGLLVGTAVIHKCTGVPGEYEWHLAEVKRLRKPRKPTGHPQPAWFKPF